MKKPIKWCIAVASALGFMLGASGSLADTITFGSANDGLGGFTQSAVVGDEIWSTSANSVQYRNQDPGTQNSSFLRAFTLDRTEGTPTPSRELLLSPICMPTTTTGLASISLEIPLWCPINLKPEQLV